MKKTAQPFAAQGFTEKLGFSGLFHDPSYSRRFEVSHDATRHQMSPLGPSYIAECRRGRLLSDCRAGNALTILPFPSH
jgi:hypothetical protein